MTTYNSSTTEQPTQIRWRMFGLALLLITVNYIDRASLSVAMPLISADLDLPASMTGVILSAFFWTYAPMQIPGGWLADRFSARWIIAASTVVWGVFEFLSGLATNALGLILARLGLGFAEAPIYPGFGKLNALWLPAHERGRGATLIDGGAPLGTALGGILITALIGVLGSWRLAFFVAGILTVALGVLAWWFIRDRPADHPQINAAERDYIAREQAKEPKPTRDPSLPPARLADFLRFRSFWGMCLGWFGFDVVFYGLVSWAPLYLAETQNLKIGAIGGATLLIFGAGFVGELFGGWLADTWRARGARANLVMRTLLGISGVLTTISIFLVGFRLAPRDAPGTDEVLTDV